jgi:hypothetical protein
VNWTATPPKQEIQLGNYDEVEMLPEGSRSESGTPMGNGAGYAAIRESPTKKKRCMLTSSKLVADFTRECALPVIVSSFLVTHPRRLLNVRVAAVVCSLQGKCSHATPSRSR